MAVKDKIGRKRYIVVLIEGKKDVSKKEMINIIRYIFFERKEISYIPWVINCYGNKSIIRCKHTDKDIVISKLNTTINYRNKKICIKTIGTTGTIRKAIKKYIC